jgi:hypothetical protein
MKPRNKAGNVVLASNVLSQSATKASQSRNRIGKFIHDHVMAVIAIIAVVLFTIWIQGRIF